MRTVLIICGAFLTLVLGGCAKTPAGEPANIAELRQFPAAEPKLSRLIKVRGVVTFADAMSDFLVIQDNTGGMLVSLSRGQTFADVGKLVEVMGRCPDEGASDFFQESSLSVIRDEPMPRAVPVSISEPEINSHLYGRVTLEGIVQSTEFLRPGLGRLVLKSGNWEVPVSTVLAGAEDIDGLAGAKVQVSGVLLKHGNNAAPPPELWVPGLQDIRVLRLGNPASFESARAQGKPVIETAKEAHRLSAEEAAAGRPVELTGVVTYFDLRPSLLFVQDKTGGIFVGLRTGSVPALHYGDLVHVTGITHPGPFAPVVSRARVALIGNAPLPEPPHDMEAAFMGQRESQWVELHGVIQSATQMPSVVLADVVWGQHSFQAQIQAPLARVAALIDRDIRIRGVCSPVFNRSRQGSGIGLFVPSISFVSPESPAIADPFQLPLRSAGSLLQFSPASNLQHRSRIRGQVTLANLAGPTWIRDGSQGIEIESHNALDLREGDYVDVAGFPFAGNYGPILRAAVIRKLSSGVPVVPLDIDASEESVAKAQSQLVRLDATLLRQSVRDGRNFLRLQSGPETFSAIIPDTKPFPALAPGSKLRVTGICSVNAESAQGLLLVRGFHLDLRTAADITVLKSAPWFTMERLGDTLFLTLALIGAAVIWVFLLRRNVRLQTRLLTAKSEQLEAAHALANEALARAREAESLEQSRRRLLELVANDDPLETILTELAKSVERHTRGVVCSMKVQLANGKQFFLPPPDSLAPEGGSAWPSEGQRMTVPILMDGNEIGQITIDSITGEGLSAHDITAFPSWSQFASLALERRSLFEKLSFRAQFDALTGLYNRATLYEKLGAELAFAQRDGIMVAVLYMDLNGFKKINDTYGHDAGDLILREAGQRIRKAVRRSDIVARIGGDEFVVVLVEIEAKEDAERIGSLLRSSLSRPVQAGSQTFACGTSLGIAFFPQDGNTVEALLKQADQRMYTEKAATRCIPSGELIEARA